MYKAIKSLVALVSVSILVVGCSAHAACDAYSYINNKSNTQKNQKQEIQKQEIHKVVVNDVNHEVI